MINLSKTWQSMERYFETVARARVQSTLLTLGPEWAGKYGYSWTALRGGIEGWPWRQPVEEEAREPVEEKAEEKEIRRAIRELDRLNDRELGLARSGIEYAVRFGHPDRDFKFTLDSRDEAA